MANEFPTDQQVNAAAAAAYATTTSAVQAAVSEYGFTWDELGEAERLDWRNQAHAALSTVAPLLAEKDATIAHNASCWSSALERAVAEHDARRLAESALAAVRAELAAARAIHDEQIQRQLGYIANVREQLDAARGCSICDDAALSEDFVSLHRACWEQEDAHLKAVVADVDEADAQGYTDGYLDALDTAAAERDAWSELVASRERSCWKAEQERDELLAQIAGSPFAKPPACSLTVASGIFCTLPKGHDGTCTDPRFFPEGRQS